MPASGNRTRSASTLAAYAVPSGGPRILAVGGGKDECGKSLVTSYIAMSMAKQDQKVVVVDCQRRGERLQHLLGADGTKARPKEYAETSQIPLRGWLGTAIPGVALLANDVPGREGQQESQFSIGPKLLESFRALPANVVLLDIGSDQDPRAIDLYNRADQRLIVATPHFLSIQYAFAFQKTAVQRLVRSCAASKEQLKLFEHECDPSEADTLPDTLIRLGARDPSYLAAIKKRIQNYRSNLVGNLVMDDREENVLHAVARMMRHYLNISVPVAGCLRASLQLYDIARSENAPALGNTKLDNQERVEDIVGHLLREKISTAPTPALDEAEDFDFGDGAVLSSSVEAIDTGVTGIPIEVASESSSGNGEGVSISPYQRRSERVRLSMHAKVRRGKEMFDAEVLELSENGASIRTDTSLRAGMWLDAFFQAEAEKAYSYEIRSVRDDNVYGLELLESFIPYAHIARWAEDFPAHHNEETSLQDAATASDLSVSNSPAPPAESLLADP